MKKFILTFLSLHLSLLNLSYSYADPAFSNCLLPASVHQDVSLGYPLAKERLATKSSVNIGVLPYYFSDTGIKVLDASQKDDYLKAADLIMRLSNQNVKIKIVFLPSFNTAKPNSELKTAFSTRGQSWSDKSFTGGTWGFVRETVKAADKTTNFSNLDSVILEGNNQDHSFDIAEAMMYFRGSSEQIFESYGLDFYKSLQTEEGMIDNAILLDQHIGPNLIAHEMLHNFGLTDLYGTGSGPGPLSLMAAGPGNLLNYEKAVLGWFPLNKISCMNFSDVYNQNKIENKLEIFDIRDDSIQILRVSKMEAFIIEILHEDNKPKFILYSIDQEGRPPISVSYDPELSYNKVFDLSDQSKIGSFYNSLDFKLLYFDKKNFNLTLYLIPNTLSKTSAALSLFEKSKVNQSDSISKAAADKAAADKAAADKAAADKAAADKAAADKAAADKAAADKAALSTKKITIICVKGKLIKSITSNKPSCPIGFKLKAK